MLPIQVKALAVASSLLYCVSSYSQASVPSHCTASEKTFISAKMQRINRSSASTTFNPTGKLLSICINAHGKSITQMTYRYGALGNVEFEQVATTTSKFAIFNQRVAPRMTDNIISFKNGSYHYYVSDALGQGHGVSLVVFKNGKKITDLFSGNEEGADFVSLRYEFDFNEVKSPVLVKKAPVDNLN